MELQGTRVLISKPTPKVYAIELAPEVKAELERKDYEKWLKLEVYAVGIDCKKIKVGDWVMVPSYSLQNAEPIPIGEDIKLMVNEGEIAIIW